MAFTRITNEAETKAELRTNKLDIPRLHAHNEAASGSRTGAAIAAYKNPSLVPLVGFYLFAVTIFAVLNSVLSVIFVVEAVTSSKGVQMPSYIPTSADVPMTHNGAQLDDCRGAFANPGCTYDLALTSLASQLVTNIPYTIGGVTFDSPNGTLGLPYYAMQHFAENVSHSLFDDEYRQYCLPVLNPHVIKCEELPFVQAWAETNDSTVLYQQMYVHEQDYFAYDNYTKLHDRLVNTTIYKIEFDYPTNLTDHRVFRTDDQGKGTMTVHHSLIPGQENITIVTASDSGGQGYSSLIHQMMYGNFSSAAARNKYPADKIVVGCTIPSLVNNTDHSSWRMVNFNMKGGILRANVTDELCPNPRGPTFSGFSDLNYAIEGAASILGGTDGYSKIFNNNTELGTGSDIFRNMTHLDATVNKIYQLVQTSYSQTSHQYSMLTESIYDSPIMMTYYPHEYVIRISWTPTTYIGLVLAICIVATCFALTLRWLLAMHHLGAEPETWNLLNPVDLMAYALAAYKDLIHDLNTPRHRREVMDERMGMKLKEYPIREGTENLIGLVRTNSDVMSRKQAPSLASTLVSPASPFGTLKRDRHEQQGLGVTVEEANSLTDSHGSTKEEHPT